jgi:hypothetical protein
VKGIEPSPQAWEAGVLPLNYTRMKWGTVVIIAYTKGNMQRFHLKKNRGIDAAASSRGRFAYQLAEKIVIMTLQKGKIKETCYIEECFWRRVAYGRQQSGKNLFASANHRLLPAGINPAAGV